MLISKSNRGEGLSVGGRKIRVLQLIGGFRMGGAERLILSLATEVNRDRFDVIPCAWGQVGPLEKELRAAGVPYRVLGLQRRSILTGPLFLLDLRRIVAALTDIMRELAIDIVHTHLTPPTLLGILATRHQYSPRLCATVHSVMLYKQRGNLSPREWLIRAGIRTVFPQADRIIAVSEAVAHAAHRQAGLPKEKIAVIPNGIDPNRFRFETSRHELRQRLDLPSERPLVIAVGRLDRPKGYPHLLAAMAAMPREERPLTLIVGDGPERYALEARAKAFDLAHDVQFLGIRHDVPALLAAADVFVLPSLWEGLPLVLLEAMAAQLPSIVTAVGENPKVIEDEKSGILVPPADEPALVAALLRLLRNPWQREQMGQAARERFERYFSLRRFVEAHERLYEEMMTELSLHA
jgi:glycosyltransferase involved in cell wall biosynthesis